MTTDGPAIGLAAQHLAQMQENGIPQMDRNTYSAWLQAGGAVCTPLARDTDQPIDVPGIFVTAVGQLQERTLALFELLFSDNPPKGLNGFFGECVGLDMTKAINNQLEAKATPAQPAPEAG